MSSNMRGIPTSMCVCGSIWFNVSVVIDEETYERSAYSTDAVCFSCGRELTIATPEDIIDAREV